jgi:hypothetical protein
VREHPWHLRLPTAENYRWFKNLVDLHELTTQWIQEAQTDRPSYTMTRGLSREVSENLWMLESLSALQLDQLLDDTLPQDTLGRLEHTIWAVQSWTVTHLYSKTNPNTNSSLDSILEQACWKLGKACVEARWPQLVKTQKLPLKNILLALNDSPFSGFPHGEGFLLRRATQNEIQVELRICPHQIHFTEVRPNSDQLCRLHAQWMRGFAYALNHRASLEHVIQGPKSIPRCIQRWFLS